MDESGSPVAGRRKRSAPPCRSTTSPPGKPPWVAKATRPSARSCDGGGEEAVSRRSQEPRECGRTPTRCPHLCPRGGLPPPPPPHLLGPPLGDVCERDAPLAVGTRGGTSQGRCEGPARARLQQQGGVGDGQGMGAQGHDARRETRGAPRCGFPLIAPPAPAPPAARACARAGRARHRACQGR